MFLHLSHVFAAVGHEDYLLALLHSLRLHHLPHPLPWFLVVSWHQAEAFRRRNRVSFRPPERHHTAARDHFEISLLVGCPHVAAVDPNGHGTVRQGEFSDRLHRRKITRLSFFSEFLFDAFGYRMPMFADR